jgi:hypothetical protein
MVSMYYMCEMTNHNRMTRFVSLCMYSGRIRGQRERWVAAHTAIP